MKFTNYRVERLPCPADPTDLILRLPERLNESGFGEALLNRLNARVFQVPRSLQVAAILRELSEKDPLGALARLFWFSQKVPASAVHKALGRDVVDRMVEWGLLVRSGRKLGSSVELVQVCGCWFATDRRYGGEWRDDVVYFPGQDSLAMCRWTPRWPALRMLDLCTGSGIQAILAGKNASYVEGFDLAVRSVDFASFNAALNGRQQCHFFQSDLFSACGDSKYECILGNPPWVPSPQHTELFRSGGANGEILVEKVCRELSRYLTPRGRAAIFVEYPLYENSPYLERIRGWLGPGSWGLALLTRCYFTTLEYVSQQTGSHFHPERDFEIWMRSYEAENIQGMGSGLLFVFRLPDDHPSWSVERLGGFPLVDVSSQVDRWLNSCLKIHAPGWEPEEVVWEEGVQVWRQGSRVRVEWPAGTFPPSEFPKIDAREMLLAGVARPAL